MLTPTAGKSMTLGQTVYNDSDDAATDVPGDLVDAIRAARRHPPQAGR